jgi:hypothetical protein
VPELLETPEVTLSEDGVRMSWTPAGTFAIAATVQRSTLSAEWPRHADWETLAELTSMDGTPLIYEDRELEPGRLHDYRLRIEWNEGVFHSHPVSILPAIRREDFRIASLSGNPVRGPLRLAVTLGSSQNARLEVLDAQGRRFQSRSLAGRRGRFEIEAGRDGALPPGVYFVRLVQGNRERRLRLVVLNSK